MLFGHFWYSKSQNDVMRSHRKHQTFARVFGFKIVEYTEMRSGLWSIKPSGLWKDYKYLGFGWFHSVKNY